MAEAAVLPTAQPQRIQSMQVHIKGRIEASRSHQGVRYTRVMTPAPDSYSRPQIVEIRSKQKLGDLGEEVQVVAKLGGYTSRPYEFKDKDSGEVITRTPVDHTLDLVE